MIVLIAGMHAVGKTHLAGPLAAQLGMRHVTASALIAGERGGTTWAKDKRVNEIEENQSALVRALSVLRRQGTDILLDGHLVLRGRSGVVSYIPTSVFREAHIEGVVLLEAPVQTLLKRLTDRDDTAWDADEVEYFVQAERAHARSVTQELKIPLTTLQNPTKDQFRQAVIDILRKKVDGVVSE